MLKIETKCEKNPHFYWSHYSFYDSITIYLEATRNYLIFLSLRVCYAFRMWCFHENSWKWKVAKCVIRRLLFNRTTHQKHCLYISQYIHTHAQPKYESEWDENSFMCKKNQNKTEPNKTKIRKKSCTHAKRMAHWPKIGRTWVKEICAHRIRYIANKKLFDYSAYGVFHFTFHI